MDIFVDNVIVLSKIFQGNKLSGFESRKSEFREGWIDGWVGGWLDVGKSHYKGCLQQSKI